MRRVLTVLASVTLLLAGLTAPPASAAPTDPRQIHVGLYRQWSGLDRPVGLTSAPGETHRMFVVERGGRIRVIRDGVLKATPFLDLTGRVNGSGEGGLLSLAFRPDYQASGYFFVTFTDANMTLHVSRFHAKPSSDVADPTGGLVLAVPHPDNTNHNGGQLQFGRDGLLYVGTGDGGGTGDPAGNAQNAGSLLGKVLRIDVTHKPAGQWYAIPPSNPYATATDGRRREIWLTGLRNPWRFSFDGNALWVADVGQGDREEVDFVTQGGLNMGWDCREGTSNTVSAYGGSYCSGRTFTPPVWEYDHSLGCAVIGGYVYRGYKYPVLAGTYVYGDYCSGRVWGFGHDSSGRRVAGEMARFAGNIQAFGRGGNGELYLLAADGGIYRITATHR